MARKFKITEEQYKALTESFNNKNNPQDKNKVYVAANGDNKQTGMSDTDAAKKAIDNFKTAGGKGEDFGGVVVLNNSRIITKKDLIENRKRKLKESSTLYQFSDFLRK